MRAALTKLPFVAALIVGIGLLVVTLALSRIGAANAAEEVVTGAAPFVTESGVGRMRADLDQVTGTAAAIAGPGLERLGAISGDSRQALLARLRARDARFVESVAALSVIGQLADMVIGNLEQRVGQFESAESLPGFGLSLSDAAWAQLALALALIALAVAGLVWRARWIGIAVLAIGVLMVAVPLVLGYPGKTSDTDAVLDSLRPFSVEKVQAREEGLATVRAFFDGYDEIVLPLVAERTGRSREQLAAEVRAAVPELSAENLQETEAALSRFDELVAFSRTIQPKLVDSDTMSATAGMWLILGPGIALLLAGSIGVFAGSRSRE